MKVRLIAALDNYVVIDSALYPVITNDSHIQIEGGTSYSLRNSETYKINIEDNIVKFIMLDKEENSTINNTTTDIKKCIFLYGQSILGHAEYSTDNIKEFKTYEFTDGTIYALDAFVEIDDLVIVFLRDNSKSLLKANYNSKLILPYKL